MAHYLVTGAAGFIGSAVAKRLVDTGNDVVTIDNLSTGQEESIPDGVVFVKGNCQDEEVVYRLSKEKFAAIIHIAGQSSGEISFENPVYDLQTNTQSTLLLLNLAQRIGCRKFIYASTMSIYGAQPDSAISENASTTMKSFYAVGKLASEHYLRIFSAFGINTTALRLFNVYGPGQNMENLKQGMVSIYLAMALRDRHILVKGSPERFRDFVYIDDAVEAFIALLNDGGKGYRCYNIATGVRTSIKELIEKIQANLSLEISVEYSGTTPGDQFGVFGDASKIRDEIGWEPRHSLDEGLRKMCDWALNKN